MNLNYFAICKSHNADLINCLYVKVYTVACYIDRHVVQMPFVVVSTLYTNYTDVDEIVVKIYYVFFTLVYINCYTYFECLLIFYSKCCRLGCTLFTLKLNLIF